MQNSIQVKGLQKSYRQLHVLNGHVTVNGFDDKQRGIFERFNSMPIAR